jgi:hypothetical protein
MILKLATAFLSAATIPAAAANHVIRSQGSLYCGGAVPFGFDEHGEAANIDAPPAIMFYRNADAVEAAISRGELHRPQICVNGAVLWQWPQGANEKPPTGGTPR